MSGQPVRVCAFSGLTVPECQESICDCFSDGVDDGAGGMGSQKPVAGGVSEGLSLRMWHGYCGPDEAEEAWISLVAGPTPVPAEPFMTLGPGKRLAHRRTWGHEPSDEEKEAELAPPPDWQEEY